MSTRSHIGFHSLNEVQHYQFPFKNGYLAGQFGVKQAQKGRKAPNWAPKHALEQQEATVTINGFIFNICLNNLSLRTNILWVIDGSIIFLHPATIFCVFSSSFPNGISVCFAWNEEQNQEAGDQRPLAEFYNLHLLAVVVAQVVEPQHSVHAGRARILGRFLTQKLIKLPILKNLS